MGRILAHAGTAASQQSVTNSTSDPLGGGTTVVEPHRPPSPTPSVAGSSSARSFESSGSSNSRGSKRSFSLANVSCTQFSIDGFGAPLPPSRSPTSASGVGAATGSASARLKRARADDRNDRNDRNERNVRDDRDDPLADRRGGRVLASLSLARIPQFNGPLI